MANKIILASAGAGKSQKIVDLALGLSRDNKRVLLLTYTENNQKELFSKICRKNLLLPTNITIKGWFSFLLEDIIRPYQQIMFYERIEGINFNSSNPHKINGKNIKGRAEILKGHYNKLHFFTKSGNKVHTAFLSKLACRVIKESQGKPIDRISQLYDSILIDEVQDLVGWDFDLLEKLNTKKSLSIYCVGDFRQTIYSTHIGSKQPRTNKEKFSKFKNLNFDFEHQNISWRCIQSICDYADRLHLSEGSYKKTISKVNKIPENFNSHTGVFAVRLDNVEEYLEKYNPIILRHSKNSLKELCRNRTCYNFGASKGMGFDRVFLITTDKQKQFIHGNLKVFDKDKTEKAKNSFYVAITRAKYSVAFLCDNEQKVSGMRIWEPD